MSVALRRVAPVLPVRSVNRALDHYRKLGFKADAYDERFGDEPIYGFLNGGGVELHLSLSQKLNPETNTSSCYLYVADANAVFDAWRRAGVGGRLDEPCDQPYGLREFVHVDPDGNLLRIGSPLETRKHVY